MRHFMTFPLDDLQRSVHLGIKSAYPNVLMGGHEGRIARVADFLENPEIRRSKRGYLVIQGTYKGMNVTAFNHGVGTGSVSATLPEIIEMCEDDRMNLLRMGSSGSLKSNIAIGDFVVTTDVERYESTSDKVMSADYQAAASSAVVDSLLKIAAEHKLPNQNLHSDKTMVTDELYHFNLKLKAQTTPFESLAVSMEASAIFAYRDFYNQKQGRSIQAGELLVVSDCLITPNHPVQHQRITSDMEQKIEEIHIRIGLETLLALSQKK